MQKFKSNLLYLRLSKKDKFVDRRDEQYIFSKLECFVRFVFFSVGQNTPNFILRFCSLVYLKIIYI
jgi:hypothetical protein